MKRIGILVCLLVLSSGVTWADTLIIAHRDVSETTLNRKEVQEIFLGKLVQWQDNSTIHPATVKAKDLHKAFLKQYLKKSASKWNAHWKRMIFTGNGTPPKQFKTEQELLKYVTETEGAIGYIDTETPVDNNNVIILQVQ